MRNTLLFKENNYFVLPIHGCPQYIKVAIKKYDFS